MNTRRDKPVTVVTLNRPVRVTPRWVTWPTFFLLQGAFVLAIVAAIAFKEVPYLGVDAYRAGGNPMLARLLVRIIAAVSLYLFLKQSIDTIFIMGPRKFLRAFRKSASISVKSWQSVKLYGIAAAEVVLGFIGYFYLGGLGIGIYLPLSSIVAAAFPVYYTLMPPVALVLGASEEHAGKAYAVAYEACRPLKVAYLLRTDCMPRTYMDVGLPQLSYRTYTFAEWQAQVKELLNIVSIVVFDLRTPTPHVAAEIEMLAGNLDDKDVIVIESGSRPELGELYERISSQSLSTVSTDEELGILMKYVWNARYGLDRVRLGRQ